MLKWDKSTCFKISRKETIKQPWGKPPRNPLCFPKKWSHLILSLIAKSTPEVWEREGTNSHEGRIGVPEGRGELMTWFGWGLGG